MTGRSPFRIQPMLATLISQPFEKSGWAYEEKYDGFRIQASTVDPLLEKGVTYLAPQLVAQIAYEELTADKKLRQPVFLGLREDKSAKECFSPGETG